MDETTQPDDGYSSRVDEPEAQVADDRPEDGWLHDEDDPDED